MGELIELLKKNAGINSHTRVPSHDIHLIGKDAERALELIMQLEQGVSNESN